MRFILIVSNERPQSTAGKSLWSSQTHHAMSHKYPYTKQNAWTEPIQPIPNTEPLPGVTPLSQKGNKSTHPVSAHLLLTVFLFNCHSTHTINKACWLLKRFKSTFYQHFTSTS